MTFSSFQVSCPLPDNITNYVSGPDTRGTLDILWSSLSILLLCTWSIQHLNVPLQFLPTSRRDRACKQRWWRFHLPEHQEMNRRLYLFFRKIKWLAINMMVPELILALALSDLVTARKYLPECERWAQHDGVEWSLGHTYFANMGGFIIRFGAEEKEDNAFEEGQLEPSESERITGEDIESSRQTRPRAISETSMTTLQNSDATVTRENLFPRVPDHPGSNSPMSETSQLPCIASETKLDHHDEIGLAGYLNSTKLWFSQYAENMLAWQRYLGLDWQIDKQNQNVMYLALQKYGPEFQQKRLLLWYSNLRVLQGTVWYIDAPQLLVAREIGLIHKLPALSAAQLEDQSKDSFVVRTITLAQALWLVVEIIVRQSQGLPVSQLEVVTLAFAACSLFTYLLLWSKPQDVQAATEIRATRRPEVHEIRSLTEAAPAVFGPHRNMPFMAGNAVHNCGEIEYGFQIGIMLGATLFGGLHCLSWNSHFPTSVERLLWRISCLIVTVSPMTMGLIWNGLSVGLRSLPDLGFKWRSVIISLFAYSWALVYLIARMYLTVEMLRALAYSPPDTFRQVDWSRYLPHIM